MYIGHEDKHSFSYYRCLYRFFFLFQQYCGDMHKISFMKVKKSVETTQMSKISTNFMAGKHIVAGTGLTCTIERNGIKQSMTKLIPLLI